MTLEEAIIYIIRKEGIHVLAHRRFLYFLQDLRSIESSAIRKIILTMIDDGYSQELINTLPKDNIELQISKTANRLSYKEGFKDELAHSVLSNFLNAFNKTIFSTSVTEEDLKYAVKDEFGAKYSPDWKRLFSVPNSTDVYRIKDGTLALDDGLTQVVNSLEESKDDFAEINSKW